MYKGFNLDLQDTQLVVDYSRIGEEIYQEQKQKVRSGLDRFQNMDNRLSGTEIINEWFREIKANIFLSHSHKDEKLVISLAGWLYEKFGLISFIDSAVWGYANNLLKLIDDKFCKNKNGLTYNYNLRNYSTSHVHMMLSSSLIHMIDVCESIIFVNTPNSFIPTDEISSGVTLSPWIFSEILITQKIRVKIPDRGTIITDSVVLAQEGKITPPVGVPIEYDADIKHLVNLKESHLKKWEALSNKSNPIENLDILYNITEKDICHGR